MTGRKKDDIQQLFCARAKNNRRKDELIDEISGGSFRLWPYAHDNPNLNQVNVLKELNPEARLDKDTYRMGDDLKKVKSRFEAIAEITAKFKDL